MFVIHLAKEPFKFSCSHFTILSADHAERLHGHNYQVRVDIKVESLEPSLGMAFDFNLIKPKIRMICDELDERILLAGQSPYLQLKTNGSQLNLTFGSKSYSFPHEDCLILPVPNVTSELLAKYICGRLIATLEPLGFWQSVSVNVEETRGQSVTYSQLR